MITRRNLIATGAFTALASTAGTNVASRELGEQTSSSSLRIVDFRVRPPFKAFRSMFPGGQRGPKISDERAMELFLAEMHGAGIECAVAMGRTAPVGPIKSMIPNDDVIALTRMYPGKFFGFGSVDVRDARSAIAEIDRCADMGLKGIAFDNPMSSPPLRNDDGSLFPIYERCAKKDLMISINSSAAIGPDISYSDPVYIQRVGKSFSDTPIVVTHASWPFVNEMISVALLGLLYGESRIYYVPDYALMSSAPGAEQYLTAANFTHIANIYSRILFGSSYPVLSPRDAVAGFRRYSIIEKEAVPAILGENARGLLRL